MTSTTRAAPGSTAATLRRSARARSLWLALCLVVLAGIIALSVTIGSRDVGGQDILAAFGGSTDGFGPAAVAKRIPRTLLAVLAGAALGVSGAVMQGVTRNPLADPGILGINTGASLAVVIGIAHFGLTAASTFIWVAILGAAATATAVYVLGSLGQGGATPLKLALAGAATGAALTSFISAVVLPRSDIGDSVRSWQIGGVGGGTYASLQQVAPFLLAGFVLSLLCSRGLNTLALGDELAAGLGERVAVTRAVAALGAVVLCGAATAVTGPIGFVGLVVPHACRLLIGVDHRWLLPFSAVTGAVLLTAADVLGRIIARPAELDVGIVTALIGAPVFIAIVRRQKLVSL
ncbi:FecCD family ABC transporter permease [Brachybacterium sacelli]|uniref:Iron complex transport system permease protein n=1 Tax=Brachybacterium sacelli TaxID=173364 RepID=A0ABS4X4Y3_9MICO|nr:iron chelate uptake ABC transporter family permease subunit [Brachybacterium sacelli]MBP2383396.1 iron complex transport system permease protein [Brachybacterium sacelli]